MEVAKGGVIEIEVHIYEYVAYIAAEKFLEQERVHYIERKHQIKCIYEHCTTLCMVDLPPNAFLGRNKPDIMILALRICSLMIDFQISG